MLIRTHNCVTEARAPSQETVVFKTSVQSLLRPSCSYGALKVSNCWVLASCNVHSNNRDMLPAAVFIVFFNAMSDNRWQTRTEIGERPGGQGRLKVEHLVKKVDKSSIQRCASCS